MQNDKEGLIQKYLVLKLHDEDGKPVTAMTADVLVTENRHGYPEGILAAGKFKDSWCFVLSPEKKDRYGYASRQALRAYADAMRGYNSKLSADIHKRLADMSG